MYSVLFCRFLNNNNDNNMRANLPFLFVKTPTNIKKLNLTWKWLNTSCYWYDLNQLQSYLSGTIFNDVNFQWDICMQYLSCYQTDFDQTLKVGFWCHLYQMPNVKVTLVQATFFLLTFWAQFFGGQTFVDCFTQTFLD